MPYTFREPPSPSDRAARSSTSPRRKQLASIENRLQPAAGSSSKTSSGSSSSSSAHSCRIKKRDLASDRASSVNQTGGKQIHADIARDGLDLRRNDARSTVADTLDGVQMVSEGDADVLMDIVTASASTGALAAIAAGSPTPGPVTSSSATQTLATKSIRTKRTASRQSARRRRRPTIHIEISLRPALNRRAAPRHDTVRKLVHEFIIRNFDSLLAESAIVDWEEIPLLDQTVESIRVAESSTGQELLRVSEVDLQIHVYQAFREYIVDSFSAAPEGKEDDANDSPEHGEDSDVMAATVAQLPSVALGGVWDNLIYEDNIKTNLLNYIHSTQIFSEKAVDFNIITWNRLVLLHGPPGTGKTSLCRALAQKLAIRMSDRYSHGKLVEINSHSIMSKWFSESGKLVQRLFTKVLELVQDTSCFVVVLIDEVESLTTARTASMGSSEPTDAVRVVNALLTQLDKLKTRKNVLVMTTSNLSESIDPAFIDRADIKQYIGLPPVQAVYWILQGCLTELVRSGLIRPNATLSDDGEESESESEAGLLDWKALQSQLAIRQSRTGRSYRSSTFRNSRKLARLAELCHGMSGRILRRLPVLAHAKYMCGAYQTTIKETCKILEEGDDDDDLFSDSDDSESSDAEDTLTEDDELDSDDHEKVPRKKRPHDDFDTISQETDSLEAWLDAMYAAIMDEKEQAGHVLQRNGLPATSAL